MALDVPCWERSVSRATANEFVEDRDVTPDELSALGRFLLDAADALRRA